jgi:hypothetical protein
MCAVISLCLGCKKEAEHIGRYKVFPASWDELVTDTAGGKPEANIVTQKNLIKVDSSTGRVWFWHHSTWNTNDEGGWIEMTDSGYVLRPSLKNQK